MFGKLRSRWRTWRRRRRARVSKEQLREFVYLDDVSVYSLLASRLGPIATEFTSTETIGLNSEMGISSGPIGPQAKASSTVESSSQVVRKAIVQTAFRDLISGVGPDLSLVRQVDAQDSAHAGSRSKVPAGEFVRGRLLEVEVVLEADPTYKLSTVIGSVSSVMQTFPDQMTPDAVAGGEMAIAVNKMLEHLTLGLIPLRCRVLGARAGEDAVVLTNREEEGAPLFVVGVTQAQKYWRDTRLVLFSKQRFRMLCRVASDGYVEDWKAIRGREVLGEVFPELDTSLEYFETGALRDLSRGAVEAQASRNGVNAAQVYVNRIAKARNEDTPALPLDFDFDGLVGHDIEVRREKYGLLEALVFGDLSRDVTAEERANFRLEAFGAPAVRQSSPRPASEYHDPVRAIEVEVVAIYW